MAGSASLFTLVLECPQGHILNSRHLLLDLGDPGLREVVGPLPSYEEERWQLESLHLEMGKLVGRASQWGSESSPWAEQPHPEAAALPGLLWLQGHSLWII